MVFPALGGRSGARLTVPDGRQAIRPAVRKLCAIHAKAYAQRSAQTFLYGRLARPLVLSCISMPANLFCVSGYIAPWPSASSSERPRRSRHGRRKLIAHSGHGQHSAWRAVPLGRDASPPISSTLIELRFQHGQPPVDITGCNRVRIGHVAAPRWRRLMIKTCGLLSKVQSVDQRMRLGMRCRLSPTADVPSHTSGAAMGQLLIFQAESRHVDDEGCAPGNFQLPFRISWRGRQMHSLRTWPTKLTSRRSASIRVV